MPKPKTKKPKRIRWESIPITRPSPDGQVRVGTLVRAVPAWGVELRLLVPLDTLKYVSWALEVNNKVVVKNDECKTVDGAKSQVLKAAIKYTEDTLRVLESLSPSDSNG